MTYVILVYIFYLFINPNPPKYIFKQVNMKKKQTIHVKEDEAFLEGINLVTGLKINYDRPILTQLELNALCIDEKYSKKQKAIKILKSGEALQKWSLFENLTFYLTTPQEYEQILHLVEKYFEDLEPMLDIIAVGLMKSVKFIIQSFEDRQQNQQGKKPFHLTEKGQKTLFRLCMRSFIDQKYNKVALEDWSALFDEFFMYLEISKSPTMKEMIEECLQYIGGSFSMNTPPERRRIAFEMIKGLIQHSQKVKERAKTNASFFSNDTNSKTRIVICQAMGKVLALQPQDDEIRKFVFDYFHDNDFLVREKSFYILLNISNEKHADAIFNAIQQQDDQIVNLVLENLEAFVANFHQFINQNKRYRNVLANMINSVFKSDEVQRISKILGFLPIVYDFCFASEKADESMFDIFLFDKLDFQEQEIFKTLINLYQQTQKDPTKKDVQKVLETQVQKNLKSPKIKENLCKNIVNFKLYLSVFTYESQEENNIYLTFLTRMIEESKWSQIQFLLQQIKQVSITEHNFQKIATLLIRLILHSPYFLIETICNSILYLQLCKRKHLQFFLTVKQKLTTSKTWAHRRNYIILYALMKTGTSYEFHKIVPLLNYKIISKEKCIGVKLQFLKYAVRIYESIDPVSQTQKMSLREAVNDMINEKDEDVAELSKQVAQKISDSDIDFLQIEKIVNRNSVFMMEQEKMRQRQALMFKKTKTQKELGRKDSKSKTITVQTRSSLRIPKELSKQLAKKQITIVNVDKLMRPNTVMGNGRNSTKSQEQKIFPNSTNGSNNTLLGSANNPSMMRIFSGQMKPPNKVTTIKKDLGFKK